MLLTCTALLMSFSLPGPRVEQLPSLHEAALAAPAKPAVLREGLPDVGPLRLLTTLPGVPVLEKGNPTRVVETAADAKPPRLLAGKLGLRF